MSPLSERGVCVRRLLVLLLVLSLPAAPLTASAPPPSNAPIPLAADDADDLAQLMAQLSADLSRVTARTAQSGTPASSAQTASTTQNRSDFANRAKELFSRLESAVLRMPVAGVRPVDISDSWGNPRDGGKRPHRGIDIFAPRGTPVVAVADGFLSYIGEQPKGGRCLWLATDDGRSFYYAHLDRWESGIYEGMEVRAGQVLGYVGTTGNARTTPPHLHFGINENDSMVNPYPVLTRASYVSRSSATEARGTSGSR